MDGDFSSSSSKTLRNSPASPQASDIQPDLSTLTCVRGICNNFVLHQDPLTGHLTLLPVHIAMLQPITGQESLSGGRLIKKSEEDIKNKSDINRESSVSPERRNVKVHPETQSVSSQRHSCIQQITHLLRHQFIFDGHLENGSEDLAMGKPFKPHFKHSDHVMNVPLRFIDLNQIYTHQLCDLLCRSSRVHLFFEEPSVREVLWSSE